MPVSSTIRPTIFALLRERGPMTADELKATGKFPGDRSLENSLYHGCTKDQFVKDERGRYSLGPAAPKPGAGEAAPSKADRAAALRRVVDRHTKPTNGASALAAPAVASGDPLVATMLSQRAAFARKIEKIDEFLKDYGA